MPILDRLLFDAGISVESFRPGINEIQRQLRETGDFATKVFEQDFGRALAKAIDPANVKQGLDRSRQIIGQFGADAQKSFERAFQREQAKRLFQPFVDETKTFSGQIKAQLRDTFSIKNLAVGSFAGFLSAGIVTEIVGGIVNIGKATTQLAADAAETRSKFNIVFGDLADDTRAFANTFADSVGRARIDTEQFLASFQGLIEPIGFTNDQAAEFSKTLTKLAVDVASFNNALDADVVRDFQSALVGETEPVKKYGIVINEARLKQEALNAGIIQTGETLTEQQKVLVRYQILLKDTSAAQGDAIRTSESLVNQQKALAANIKNLGESIGSALVPAINAVVGGLNDLFSSATETEKLVVELQKLGIAANELSFLSVIAQTERAQKTIDELSASIELLTRDFTLLDDTAVSIQGNFVDRVIGNPETVGEVARGFLDIAEQADGINKLQTRIGDSTQRILDLTRQLVDIRTGRREGDEGQIRQEIELERERVRIAGEVLQFRQAIAAQERIIAENNRQQTETVLEAVTVEAKRLTLAELTTKQLRDMLEANQGSRKEVEKELATREKTAKFISEINKQLELITAADDVQKKLIQIRQEADERRKIYADSAESIRQINRLEREERRKTLDEFEARLRQQVQQRIQQIVSIDFQPQLITSLKLPVIEINQQDAKTIGERINTTLNDALLQTPASILLNKISDLGPLIDEEFVNFVGIIDRGLADVLAGIANFAASISSGNILGAITGAISLIGRLFGGGDSTRKRIETEKQFQQAQEESARAAEKAAQALENLRRAVDQFSAGALIDEITKLNDEFLRVTNGTQALTTEQQKLAVQLLKESELIRATIAGLEAEKRTTTDPERLREIEEELIKYNALLDEHGRALLDVGIDMSNVTVLELERLKVLLQEKGVFEDAVNRFRAFGDGLRGLIDRLQLGFELLETTDPAKKLEELLKALTETFAFEVPAQFADLNEFILGGFEALKQGGQALIDFLLAADLEELTAEEFADLLRMLNEFSNGVGQVADDTRDALADLLDALQIDFNVLDIDDPTEKLELFRQAIQNTFGAVLPETFNGLKEFVLQGFFALRGDAELLKQFLESVNLEELTREQFESLLLNLEGFLDEFGSQFSDLRDRLNLQFDLLKIDDFAEKMKRLREALVSEFNAILPEAGAELEKFIQDGVAAILAGGESLKTFLSQVGLEELTAKEFEELLRQLRDLQDGIDNTSGAVEKATDAFDTFRRGFEFVIDILDVTDPTEKLRLFRDAVNTTFGADIPASFEELKKFILDGFIALNAAGENLDEFLASLGLEELTKEQFEDLLRELEGQLDAIGSAFKRLTDRLSLEFNLLDVDDPLARLERLRQEIKKEFNAIIPDTTEAIDVLIKEGVAALLAGGDALKAFLASVDLEELTAEQFQDFLEFLKGIADDAKKAAKEITGVDEEAGISVVKQITFQQANVMLNELATIREILTQMLNIFRGGIPGAANEPVFADRTIIEELGGISAEAQKTNLQLIALNAETAMMRDVLQEILDSLEEERALDISTTSPDRLMVNRLDSILSEIVTTNGLLEDGFDRTINAIYSTGGSPSVFGGGNFGFADTSSMLATMNDTARAHYESSLQANVLLAQLVNESTASRAGAGAGMSIYIVKGDTVSQVSMNDLEEVDRRLIEKSIIRSRSRGVV